jgi:hypothetical protein
VKGYRWCTGCQQGHPADESPCAVWLAALAVREAALEQRRQDWQRARNRAQRWRKCITCGRRWDAGPPKRGRPSETCSAACADIREADNQRARRAGTPVQRRRNKTGLRTRGVLRATPELLDFLGAFPDGWSYEGFNRY